MTSGEAHASDEVNPLPRRCRSPQPAGMSTHDESISGPLGKPSQAEGEAAGPSDAQEPLPAEGHPSQAEGEDTEAQAADDESGGRSSDA